MKERNITVTLEKAREWYNSDNKSLKEIALQAFDKEELIHNFKDIKTLENACEALGLNYSIISIVAKDVATFSVASAAMFKLNIIRKALNLGHHLYLTKGSCAYYPCNPLVTKSSTYYKSELNSGRIKVIGKIKSEGGEYYILGGDTDFGSGAGLGDFYSSNGVSYAGATSGFLGCATKEIAEHFSRYFGMLITEAKYADMIDFVLIKKSCISTKQP